MDQRPVDGSDPLPAPSPDTAAAYLGELERVRERREERIDRRALAVASVVNAVVLSVYVAIACFTIGAGPTNSSFLVVLALFLLWIQLISEFRESHGALGSPLSRNRSVTIGFVGVLLVVVIAGIVISAFGVDVPVFVRVIPALLALLIVGVPALRDFRGSSRLDATVPLRPLSRAERWVTSGVAVVMAMSIWVLGAGEFQLISIFAMVLMVSYLAWWIAGRTTERLPVLGAVWARPQWMAFAVSGAAVAAIMIAQLLGLTASTRALAPWGAAIVLLLMVSSAFIDGRDG